MALDTVGEIITRARELIQDTITPYRYSDASMLDILNSGLLEIRLKRPDLFLPSRQAPEYTSSSAALALDPQYRMSLVYYVAGHAQLRDDEDTQDSRASALINKFTSQLLTVAS